MSDHAQQRARRSARRRARRRPAQWLAVVVLVLVVLYLVAGYGLGWGWTGLSRRVTLWDWLEGLALPMTVALVPLLIRRRQHLRRPHRAAGVVVLVVFAAVVSAGYLVPWSWTGFTGNTLWDWLSLALLPLVIATSALWQPPPRWTRRHVSAVAVASVIIVAVVLAGYLVPWSWTGFTGNTAWDWIKLLLLPLLLPTVVLPRLLASADAWLMPRGAADPSPPTPEPETV